MTRDSVGRKFCEHEFLVLCSFNLWLVENVNRIIYAMNVAIKIMIQPLLLKKITQQNFATDIARKVVKQNTYYLCER